jgi:hypothetical protein
MFKHALTHDVAYESLLRHGSGALYSRVSDVIEELSPTGSWSSTRRWPGPTCEPRCGGRLVGSPGENWRPPPARPLRTRLRPRGRKRLDGIDQPFLKLDRREARKLPRARVVTVEAEQRDVGPPEQVGDDRIAVRCHEEPRLEAAGLAGAVRAPPCWPAARCSGPSARCRARAAGPSPPLPCRWRASRSRCGGRPARRASARPRFLDERPRRRRCEARHVRGGTRTGRRTSRTSHRAGRWRG